MARKLELQASVAHLRRQGAPLADGPGQLSRAKSKKSKKLGAGGTGPIERTNINRFVARPIDVRQMEAHDDPGLRSERVSQRKQTYGEKLAKLFPAEHQRFVDRELQKWRFLAGPAVDRLNEAASDESPGMLTIDDIQEVARSAPWFHGMSSIVGHDPFEDEGMNAFENHVDLGSSTDLRFRTRLSSPGADRIPYWISVARTDNAKDSAPLHTISKRANEAAQGQFVGLRVGLRQVSSFATHDLYGHTLCDAHWKTRASAELSEFEVRTEHKTGQFNPNSYEEMLFRMMARIHEGARKMTPKLGVVHARDAEGYRALAERYRDMRLSEAIEALEALPPEDRAQYLLEALEMAEAELLHFLTLYMNKNLLFVIEPDRVEDEAGNARASLDRELRKVVSSGASERVDDLTRRILIEHPALAGALGERASELLGIERPAREETTEVRGSNGTPEARLGRIFGAYPELWNGTRVQQAIHDDAPRRNMKTGELWPNTKIERAVFGASRHYDANPDLAMGLRLAGMNQAQAMKHLEKATAEGDGAAAYALARIYSSGVRVPQDPSRSRSLMERAAGLGYSQAAVELADQVPLGSDEWMKWMEAAEKSAEALYALAQQHPAGSIERRVLLEDAANAEHFDALMDLAELHREGPDKDLSAAFGYTARANNLWQLNRGNPRVAEAQYWVGRHFSEGLGVDRDVGEGRRFLVFARDNGYAAAEAALKELDAQME